MGDRDVRCHSYVGRMRREASLKGVGVHPILAKAVKSDTDGLRRRRKETSQHGGDAFVEKTASRMWLTSFYSNWEFASLPRTRSERSDMPRAAAVQCL